MYLINTSFHVDKSIYEEAVEAVKTRYIPMIETSGLFFEPLMTRILMEVDPACQSFGVQMKTESLDSAAGWLETTGGAFFSEMQRRYGQCFLFFTTPMEIIG